MYIRHTLYVPGKLLLSIKDSSFTNSLILASLQPSSGSFLCATEEKKLNEKGGEQ